MNFQTRRRGDVPSLVVGAIHADTVSPVSERSDGRNCADGNRAASLDLRLDQVLDRLTLEDKVGLMFHSMAIPGDPRVQVFDIPSVESLIVDHHMNHFNVLGALPDGRSFARWHNDVQRIAMESGGGVPVTFSTDPRHGFTDNPMTAALAGPFSQWPDPIGLAAIRSPELVEEFADIARQEYLAVGLRVALHPQVDLATDPRWCRISGTFGEDVDLTSQLLAAYIRGFQGESLGPHSVSTMTKHFPGGGPQKNGEDPHFSYGREQVYPGDRFDLHLQPFISAILCGGSQMMPYYGMPIGTSFEECGFGFNKSVLTHLLRDDLHFDGIICTDWGVLTDFNFFGEVVPARAWGVEHLSRDERIIKALDAGVDQFGGETCTEALVNLVRSHRVAEARVDESVRRLLREKIKLGLYQNHLVDEDRASDVLGRADFRHAGIAAQRRSVTVLINHLASRASLPLSPDLVVYAEGIDANVLSNYCNVTPDIDHADIAILRIKAPYESRVGGFERLFHAGTLEFSAIELSHLDAVCRSLPTVIDVHLDRPAVLTTLADEVAAMVATYGCCDEALLDVLFGRAFPEGALPFDVPRSMAAVAASREDVPFDTADPLFKFGHGFRY
jgi:beta-glucosidase